VGGARSRFEAKVRESVNIMGRFLSK